MFGKELSISINLYLFVVSLIGLPFQNQSTLLMKSHLPIASVIVTREKERMLKDIASLREKPVSSKENKS